jgi:hypothetical protein
LVSVSELGSAFKKLDPDSDTDTEADPEGYRFCIAIRTEVTGQEPESRDQEPEASLALVYAFSKRLAASGTFDEISVRP